MKVKTLIPLMLSACVSASVFAACGNGDAESETTKLSAPVITLSGNVISWSAVDNASAYTVSENDAEVSKDQTQLSYTIDKTEPGTYTYTVKATSSDPKYSASDSSNAVEYTVAAAAADTSVKLTGKIYVVGDSTVCDYSDKLDDAYLPRYGYGTQLYNYINCDTNQIVNLAISGRSSKSFLIESNYNTLKNGIAAGDYLIIGFGHNDEKNEAARFTDPNADYLTPTTSKGPSFQYTLYENYVKVAKDAGATPILCTPIVRYDKENKYTGSSVHVTSDGDYAQAIRKLGTDTGTAVVDLTNLTKELYQKDNEAAKNFHYISKYIGNWEDNTPDYDTIDTTHLNKFGAKEVAYLFAQAIKDSDCALKSNIRTDSVEPTFAADFNDARKEDYVNPVYTPFDPAEHQSSKLCTLETNTPSDWFKTAFGDIGGNKANDFTKSYSDSKFTVGIASKTGKFASGGDGFAAAFTYIPTDKNFTASAKFTITSISDTYADTQSGVGLMLRDDIYMDQYLTGIKSNFAAAGATHKKSALFHRESSTLAYDAAAITLVTGKEYTVSIERNGQNIKTTFSDGANNYEKTFLDLKMNIIDSDYMYLCLFATRGIIAEFSDVTLNITGDAGEA